MEKVSAKVVRRKYWAGKSMLYPNMIHDGEDRLRSDVLYELLDQVGAGDGDEVEVAVRKTGSRPFEGTIYALVKPHHYERVATNSRYGPQPLTEVGKGER